MAVVAVDATIDFKNSQLLKVDGHAAAAGRPACPRGHRPGTRGFCHGFPELWYSWRHQLPALAKAGYHAVAPDQRGYGQTDRPEAIEADNILALTGDIVGLAAALGEERAIIIGHDWGSPVAWHFALLRPDLFHAVALLSVPVAAPGRTSAPQSR